jgi:hypothetical protein
MKHYISLFASGFAFGAGITLGSAIAANVARQPFKLYLVKEKK